MSPNLKYPDKNWIMATVHCVIRITTPPFNGYNYVDTFRVCTNIKSYITTEDDFNNIKSQIVNAVNGHLIYRALSKYQQFTEYSIDPTIVVVRNGNLYNIEDKDYYLSTIPPPDMNFNKG